MLTRELCAAVEDELAALRRQLAEERAKREARERERQAEAAFRVTVSVSFATRANVFANVSSSIASRPSVAIARRKLAGVTYPSRSGSNRRAHFVVSEAPFRGTRSANLSRAIRRKRATSGLAGKGGGVRAETGA